VNPNEILDISKEAIWVLIKISLPVMLVAMAVGLVISLFQALTQIQEMTLSFVPKIIAVFVAIIILLPFMIDQLQNFSEYLMNKIVLR
jgi:flagellar biosynthetic protein FliQ